MSATTAQNMYGFANRHASATSSGPGGRHPTEDVEVGVAGGLIVWGSRGGARPSALPVGDITNRDSALVTGAGRAGSREPLCPPLTPASPVRQQQPRMHGLTARDRRRARR
ncbi:hypothetical protein BBP40_011780 [Aspergillus hancockii]|nr:hypothetical protein BBP40_011780 [Aspergillus hancockii]